MPSRDPISPISQTAAAEDFMAARKRLREARIRWIEEHECPQPYSVNAGKDGGGQQQTFSTPFEIGTRRYEGDPPKEYKPTFLPEPTRDAAQDREELDRIIAEADSFMRPGIYRESAHPPLREGEEYGEYCERLGHEYEQAAGSRAIRRTDPNSHGVRQSTYADPDSGGGALAPGASDSRPGELGSLRHADADDSPHEG